MAKYRLFAGLGGGFGGAHCHGIYDFDSAEEADRAAYDLAWEEYESYAGSHGIPSWDDIYADCLESEYIEPEAQSEAEVETTVDDYYVEAVEGWIIWYAEEVVDWDKYDDEDEDDIYDDDDADCYCE